MNNSEYSEEKLVELPAIKLFKELGWQTVNAYNEFDKGISILGRSDRGEVVLKDRLLKKLAELNPTLPSEALSTAYEELNAKRGFMSLVAANREVYRLIKDGVRVSVKDSLTDEETDEMVRLIDWENPYNNDFLLCSQLWITGEMHTRRTDLVGFVNGIPLVFVELKASHKRIEAAFTDNLRDYKDTIPHLLWANAIIILSNGSHSRFGSITGGWEHFNEWKKIDHEEEVGRISLETMIRGLCAPDKLLDIVENFIVFQDKVGGTIKLIAKNHQYLGVNNAIVALSEVHDTKGKLGVFWHTQGSGKSVSMLFFAQKVFRKVPGNWTFVVVTDRQELDVQIYTQFTNSGVLTENRAQAESCHHLRELLREDHRYVFTLIHKFRTEGDLPHPVLSERNNIIVITDEAHRSQYDTLAMNMRTALPNASFIAFTGTPLIKGEEKTKHVFGDYVSIYDFQQSVVDGSTVPLYYENRIPELQLSNDDLNEDIQRLLEEAELDETQEKRLEREFAREYHIITREERLETIAEDLVNHFIARGFRGKGMMICIDKATAVTMYDKVHKYWLEKIIELNRELPIAEDKDDLLEKIAWMKETDMAVVVSQGQNEIAEMKEKGVDIRLHRKRMVDEDLEIKFKDPQNPLRLVFVCAMWITGFDVPSCSTLYLDKPMRNHTLMQTIARANRVYPDKVSGLIVDYCGVFRNIEEALAIYGKTSSGTGGGSGGKPVEDKTVLIEALRQALIGIKNFFVEIGIVLEDINKVEGFNRIAKLDDAVESLLVTEQTKKSFLEQANNIKRLYKAILPDTKAEEFRSDVSLIQTIADKIRALTPPGLNPEELARRINEILDHSIVPDSYSISADSDQKHLIDLSSIDFDELAKRFDKGRKRTINEKMKTAIELKLEAMVKINRTRMNYLEKFQQMIEDYNAGRMNQEELFWKLIEFTQSLNAEEQRSISEQLSEEELALFDVLTKPEIDMTPEDKNKVKATAKDLLETLKKEKLVLDWRKHQKPRAQVYTTIRDKLEKGLPRAYTPELFKTKVSSVFQHVYDSYYGVGRSVYATIQ